MSTPLHGDPDPVHLFKQHRNCSGPFCLVCIHLGDLLFFLSVDPFSQLLHQMPDTTMADRLTTGITYCLRGNSVW